MGVPGRVYQLSVNIKKAYGLVRRIEFRRPMKLVRLIIKMCLYDTLGKVLKETFV
jgi:hypothetical protein